MPEYILYIITYYSKFCKLPQHQAVGALGSVNTRIIEGYSEAVTVMKFI